MTEVSNKAGLIPFYINDNKIYMLFMIPSEIKYGGLCFQISKGEIESTENAEAASLREAIEELGIKEENTSNLYKVGKFFVETRNCNYNLNVFIAEYKNIYDLNEPCYETKNVKWLTPYMFYERGRKNQRYIVEKAEEMIISMREIKQGE